MLQILFLKKHKFWDKKTKTKNLTTCATLPSSGLGFERKINYLYVNYEFNQQYF